MDDEIAMTRSEDWSICVDPTLEDATARGRLSDVETIWQCRADDSDLTPRVSFLCTTKLIDWRNRWSPGRACFSAGPPM
jgi:hypothetical protein